MRSIKIIVFILIILLYLVYCYCVKVVVPKKFVYFNLLGLILFIPYFFVSEDLLGALNYFFNFVCSCLMVFIGLTYVDLDSNRSFPYKFLFFLTTVYSIIPTINFFTGYPEWEVWAPISKYRETSEMRAFWATGFNGNRTGWSESLSLFVPLVLLFLENSKNPLITILFFCFPILTSQVISGGRNGLLASLIAIVIIIIRKYGWPGIMKTLGFIILVFTFFLYEYTEDILILFRIYDKTSGVINEDLTTNRSVMYNAFFEIYLESPFFGKGYLGSQKALFPKYIAEDGLEMHNGILRVFIDHGLFFGILMLSLLSFSIKVAVHNVLKKDKSVFNFMFSIIVLQGVFISLFQPLSLFGGFQISVLWWLSLGFIIRNNFNN